MLLIPNALCWSSRKCNCACALPAEEQLCLCVTRRSWQKLFAGKNFIKILVTMQMQLHSYSEQQRAFGNSNICNWCDVDECWLSTQIVISGTYIKHKGIENIRKWGIIEHIFVSSTPRVESLPAPEVLNPCLWQLRHVCDAFFFSEERSHSRMWFQDGSP